MRIEDRFTVPFPRQQVWTFLHDIEGVIGCLPGAELIETDGDGRVAGRFSVKLGPIAATFSGEGRINFDESGQRGVITGAGSDSKSATRARGSAAFTLAEDTNGTRMELAVDYTLAGALAQFNRSGIVRDLATRLTAQFAENLRTALASAAPEPAPIAAGRMLARIIWDRFRRWLRALLGRD